MAALALFTGAYMAEIVRAGVQVMLYFDHVGGFGTGRVLHGARDPRAPAFLRQVP